MRLLDRFKRGRSSPVPLIDPPGYRLSTPPPPPPPGPAPSAAPSADPSKPSMRLMLADGTMQDLPHDPELEARAEYLIRSMLPPAPPPPPVPS